MDLHSDVVIDFEQCIDLLLNGVVADHVEVLVVVEDPTENGVDLVEYLLGDVG